MHRPRPWLGWHRPARARAAAGRLAEQPVGPGALAEILRELFREDAPDDGIFGAVAQLLTAAGRAAARIDADRGEDDGEVPGLLEEAGAFVTDSAGLRLHYATRTYDALLKQARAEEDEAEQVLKQLDTRN